MLERVLPALDNPKLTEKRSVNVERSKPHPFRQDPTRRDPQRSCVRRRALYRVSGYPLGRTDAPRAIPRKYIPTLNAIQEDDRFLIGHLVLVAGRIAAQSGIAEDGYRLVVNCNPHGGQTVYHLHLHVLGGRAMLWPPG